MEDQVFYQCMIFGSDLAAACYIDGCEETIIDYSNLYTTLDAAGEYYEEFIKSKIEEIDYEYGLEPGDEGYDDVINEIEETYSYDIKELRVIK